MFFFYEDQCDLYLSIFEVPQERTRSENRMIGDQISFEEIVLRLPVKIFI